MMKYLTAFFCCVAFGGCFTIGVEYFSIEKGGTHAKGDAVSQEAGGDRIKSIEIDLTSVDNDFLHDKWIELT